MDGINVMIDKVKRAIKMGNLSNKIPCYIFEKLGFSNEEIQDLEVRNKSYIYFKKKYSKYLDGISKTDYKVETDNKIVWVCWFQGYDNAPDIVKKCIDSMYKWLPEYQIVIITTENLFKYIELPDYIIEKWKNGIITNTLFSDFVRLDLLNRYGGIWIDSTVYFTGPLPQYVNSSDFFMFRCNHYDIPKFGESWFIKSSPNNEVLYKTLQLMNEYWKHESKIRDYFQMFIFMKIVIERDSSKIKNMIKIPNSIPHMLQAYLNDGFDKDIYNEICKITPIHKLTYKNIDWNVKNSFVNYIINDGA